MLIDTHCHLDAAEFDADREASSARPRASVDSGAGGRLQFRCRGGPVTGPPGLPPRLRHPPDVRRQGEAGRSRTPAESGSPKTAVAVGEIGLDGFVPDGDLPLQMRIFEAQLRLARDVRAAGGAAHPPRPGRDPSFCGGFRCLGGITRSTEAVSRPTPHRAGFRLGLAGDDLTRSRRIRRTGGNLPPESIVLEPTRRTSRSVPPGSVTIRPTWPRFCSPSWRRAEDMPAVRS